MIKVLFAILALAVLVLVILYLRGRSYIYRVSVFNVVSGFFLIGTVIYTIINWSVLSKEEGWGVVAMVAVVTTAVVTLVVDFIAQQIIKNRRALIILEGLVVIIILILTLWPGGR